MLEVDWDSFSTYLYLDRKLDRSNDYSYRSRFKILSEFFIDKPFDKLHINMFLAQMQAKNRSNSTLNNYIKLIKHLSRYLFENGKIESDFFERYTYFRKQVPSYRLLTVEEVKKLVTCYIERGYNKDSLKINYRYSTAIHFMVVTGVRGNEMCKLQWRDVMPDRIIIRSENSKSDRPRQIPIIKETYVLLNKLEKWEHEFVFGDYRSKMDLGTFNRELKNRAKYLKFKDWDKISSHLFRHFAATQWRKSGVQIDIVSKLLGHSNVDITAKTYSHYEIEDFRTAIDLSPLFVEQISFDTVKKKANDFMEFVKMTRFPLHTQSTKDIIILQVQNEL